MSLPLSTRSLTIPECTLGDLHPPTQSTGPNGSTILNLIDYRPRPGVITFVTLMHYDLGPNESTILNLMAITFGT